MRGSDTQAEAAARSDDSAESESPPGPFRRPAFIAVCLLAVALVIAAVGLGGAARRQNLIARVADTFDPYSISIRHRIGLVIVTSSMIAEHPIIGAGPGRYGPAFDRARGRLAERSEGVGSWVFNDFLNDQAASEAHSDPLQWWAEYGLLPILGLILMMASSFVALVRAMRSGGPNHLAALLLAALLALSISMLFAFPLQRPSRAILFWCLLGMTRIGEPDGVR